MFQNIINAVSVLAIPVIVLVIPIWGYYKKIKVYEVFTDGAKEGFQVAIKIIPYLVAILVAIGAFRTSGALELLAKVLSPVTGLIGMPGELVPMAFMRPLSGSGALGIVSELVTTHGPESMIGRMASVMEGSTETTFYVLAVYFGSVSIRNSRHALPAALTADLAGIIAAVLVCHLVF